MGQLQKYKKCVKARREKANDEKDSIEKILDEDKDMRSIMKKYLRNSYIESVSNKDKAFTVLVGSSYSYSKTKTLVYHNLKLLIDGLYRWKWNLKNNIEIDFDNLLMVTAIYEKGAYVKNDEIKLSTMFKLKHASQIAYHKHFDENVKICLCKENIEKIKIYKFDIMLKDSMNGDLFNYLSPDLYEDEPKISNKYRYDDSEILLNKNYYVTPHINKENLNFVCFNKINYNKLKMIDNLEEIKSDLNIIELCSNIYNGLENYYNDDNCKFTVDYHCQLLKSYLKKINKRTDKIVFKYKMHVGKYRLIPSPFKSFTDNPFSYFDSLLRNNKKVLNYPFSIKVKFAEEIRKMNKIEEKIFGNVMYRRLCIRGFLRDLILKDLENKEEKKENNLYENKYAERRINSNKNLNKFLSNKERVYVK